MKKLLVLMALLVGASASAQTRSTISYIHPDAAAPGMAIYTELIGPDTKGNFGADGLNNVSIEFVNPLDALRVFIGPRVTSWNGRVVSLFVIVPNGAATGPVPFRVVVNGERSNVETFNIVDAQTLPENLASGALGSGGDYGTRSPRNTMVVESLHLGEGTFTVSDIDPDPATPGNQSYLPFTILSKGDVSIEGELTVGGNGKNAIAGGGGGGGAYTVNDHDPARNVGGNGYSAGGGMHDVGGIGSGSTADGWNGGNSLNRAPGGQGLGDRWWDDQGGGGGTGFPFGTQSQAGTWYAEGGNSPAGGVGGGGGGGEKSMPDSSFGGGGGAFATDGGNSGTGGFNGGKAYGNPLIVPFCGGSGGGGGNQFGDGYAGVGGAGGGAIHIFSMREIDILGTIASNGADGEGTHNIFKGGGGGGGAGGAIALTAPIIDLVGDLSVKGGMGGEAVLRPERGGLPGGDGGEGRIRLIGLVQHCPANVQPVIGPTVAHMSVTNGALKLEGTGRAGDSLLIYAERQGTWNYQEPLRTMVTEHGDWQVLCPSSMMNCSHISVLEQIHTAEAAPFVQSPLWVFSTQTVTPPEATSDVAAQGVSHSLLIGVVRFDANWMHATITGSSMESVEYQLLDILGREVTHRSIQLDGAGNYELDLNSSTLRNGNYILAVRSGTSLVSKNISIAR
jgi:hypothetical protein